MKESQPTQQFVEIEEIKDGTIILKNGSLRRVLIVSGINFELKSEEEQNIIIYAFQEFLNALDFSVQLVIHSRRLNIEGYLNKLRKRKNQEENELLKNQIAEYIEFINSFIQSNPVMTKTFFAVVPYDPIVVPSGGKKIFDFLKFGPLKNKTALSEKTFEEKLTQLNQRTDQVIEGLSRIGLRVVALEDEELIELFYNLYNPESREKRELEIAKE